jgi:hypothetical protein
LLVDEGGRSWIVDRTGTYPRGPKLPGGNRASLACRFRRSIVALDGGGYAYWRDEFRVHVWPQALSAEISADGCRIVIALADAVEVYEDAP